jgi:hypothetical protein
MVGQSANQQTVAVRFRPLRSNIIEETTLFPELWLEFCSSGDPRYKEIRKDHYVVNKGCHGQQVHFIIWYKGEIAGIVSGGGAVFATAARDKFFKITKENRTKVLNGIVDNIIFRLINHEYNLGSRVLSLWEKAVVEIWESLYGVKVFGFETFIVREGLMREKKTAKKDKQGRPVRKVYIVPDSKKNVRRGSMYKAANWLQVGETSGSTKGHDEVGMTGAPRLGGKGGFLRKKTSIKDIYCKWISGYSEPVESVYKSSWKSATKVGTEEEKEIAKQKSRMRKTLMGQKFYLKGKKVVRENQKEETMAEHTCVKCGKTYQKDRGYKHRDGLCIGNAVDLTGDSQVPVVGQTEQSVPTPRNPYENLLFKIEEKKKELAMLEAKKKEIDSLFE